MGLSLENRVCTRFEWLQTICRHSTYFRNRLGSVSNFRGIQRTAVSAGVAHGSKRAAPIGRGGGLLRPRLKDKQRATKRCHTQEFGSVGLAPRLVSTQGDRSQSGLFSLHALPGRTHCLISQVPISHCAYDHSQSCTKLSGRNGVK